MWCLRINRHPPNPVWPTPYEPVWEATKNGRIPTVSSTPILVTTVQFKKTKTKIRLDLIRLSVKGQKNRASEINCWIVGKKSGTTISSGKKRKSESSTKRRDIYN